MSQIKYINLADIRLPEFEAHKSINNDQISEISKSIKEIGIIEPIIVRKVNKQIEIVAGCIRYRAAKLAGLKALPCIILQLNDDEAEILKLHENLKRIDLDHIDQGHTFVMMQEKFNMTEETIAASSGKSTAYVSQHISLVNIDAYLSAAVKNKTLSFSQARELLQVKDKSTRKQLMQYCQRDGATIEVLRTWIKEYNDQQAIKPSSSEQSPAAPLKYETVQDFRKCEACDKKVPLGHIRQVFYCPECYNAIKQAIENEKTKQHG
ncbi:hypothetical protein LCGC14_2227840 [marine sediment metagenome]|uniref:ParB-like N-terminal domain-containing protein n=1 Tax=marine sediment metagenome TaxID=412755 RepID=A0A0F9D927_9ZZZZ